MRLRRALRLRREHIDAIIAQMDAARAAYDRRAG